MSLKTFRLVTLSLVSVLALVVLALGAHMTNTLSFASTVLEFSALAVATAVLTLVSLPVMLSIDMVRTGAFTSWVSVEFGVVTFLWIMWLATAGKTTSVYVITPFTSGQCGAYFYSDIQALCAEWPTVMAISFFNWIILKVYSITLLVYAIQGHNRGHKNVWQATVKQGDFLGPAPPPEQANMAAEQKAGMTYQYPPSGYPPQQAYPTPPPQGYPQQPYGGTPPPQHYGGSPPPQPPYGGPQLPYTAASPPPPQGHYPQV